jgi:hypothetical protein
MDGPYDTLSHFFLELRGRGLSLSAMDAEVIFKWKQTEVPVEVIMDISWAMADECQTQNRPFPSNLVPIDRRVQKYLKHKNQF